MKISLLLGLLLASEAASAQQPAASPQAQVYRDGSGQLRVRKLPQLAADAKAGPGSYRADSYALRVQVPPPHHDSVAVVVPGPRRDAMPQCALPPVRLRPTGPGKP